VKLVAGKKSAIGDKPAVRRNGVTVALDVERMPLVRGVSTVEEFSQQQANVRSPVAYGYTDDESVPPVDPRRWHIWERQYVAIPASDTMPEHCIASYIEQH
jgi:hypothetical protein